MPNPAGPLVRLPAPAPGEEVTLVSPSGHHFPCRVRARQNGLIELAPDGERHSLPPLGPVVLRRVRDGQSYLFSEQLLHRSPLVLTLSRPEVVREARVPARPSLYYAPSDGSAPPQKTRMLDLSSRGLSFRAWLPAPPLGAGLELEFELYPYGQVRAQACVVAVHPYTPSWPEVGVEFTALSPSGRAAVFAWLRHPVTFG